jgi:hypothetical protein
MYRQDSPAAGRKHFSVVGIKIMRAMAADSAGTV